MTKKFSELAEETIFDGTEQLALVNSVGVSNKATLKNLNDFISASNAVIINSISDFPDAVSQVITLENGKAYIFNTTIVTSNRFVIPVGARVTFTSVDLGHSLVYTGVDTLFTATDFGSFITEKLFCVGNASCTFFDFDNAGSVFLFSSIFTTCAKIGNVKCNAYSLVFTAFSVYGDGIVFDDRTDAVKRARVSIRNAGFSLGLNNSITLIQFKGNLDAILIVNGGALAGSNETLFDFDESLKSNNVVIEVQGFATTLPFSGNAIFAPNSLKQDYINALFLGNIGIKSSTVKIDTDFTGNTLETTISSSNTPTQINNGQLWAVNSMERMFFQDEVTFDNGTNTVNTTFNHGLTENDNILLHTYTGILPTELTSAVEYFAISVTASGFQLSLTSGGGAINFTDDGSGTLYFRHETGTSPRNQVIYLGNADISIATSGWIAIANSDASDNDYRCVLMKIDTAFGFTVAKRGSVSNGDDTKPQSSSIPAIVDLVTGEGLEIYIENNSNTDNLIAEAGSISYKMA